ncbi:hypothetical protein ABZ622_20130 [Streptomyces sp. NPDC007164]
MLAGVEHDEQLLPLEMVDDRVQWLHPGLIRDSQHGGQRRGYQFRVG